VAVSVVVGILAIVTSMWQRYRAKVGSGAGVAPAVGSIALVTPQAADQLKQLAVVAQALEEDHIQLRYSQIFFRPASVILDFEAKVANDKSQVAALTAALTKGSENIMMAGIE
jgi:hypothetical protein